MTVPEVRTLLRHLLDVRHWDEKEIIAWSGWRQERNRTASECHAKRRARQLRSKSVKRAL